MGFNNSGQILLSDPGLYSPGVGETLSASTLSGLSGAVNNSSTSTFQQVSAAQGGATPTSTFYTDPTASTSSIALGTVGSSGVPGPATEGLLLLAALGVLGLRKRNKLSIAV